MQKMAFAIGTLDSTIRASMGVIHQHKIGGAIGVVPELSTAAATALNTLNDPGTLYIDGHAAAPEQLGIPRAAIQFGGLTAEALADLAIRKGLRASFTGKIYLNGCNTANSDGMSYAQRFQFALSLRGVRCIVKGNAGYSQVAPATGHTLVVPSTADGARERAELARLEGEASRLHGEINRIAQDLRNNPMAADWHVKRGLIATHKGDLVTVKGQADLQHPRTFLPTKALRPTLPALAGITHYESGAGTYAALPAQVGASGKALDAHVSAALAKYARKWKFKASQASTAAVPVLRGALANYPALLMAIHWYTGLGPKPPMSLVATGAALSRTSSLYLMLLGEFVYWQSGRAPRE